MGLSSILIGIATYLLLGVVLLIIFDITTERIRSKFAQATSKTQSELASSGNYVGDKLAAVLFIGAMWLFWPMVFIGALTDKADNKEGSNGKKG
jgi:hypothetical protein